jgi:hypothetical protein
MRKNADGTCEHLDFTGCSMSSIGSMTKNRIQMKNDE